ncbi:hypothetical protein D9615_002254 [Tricholomella constricta]|uniref:Uncharacterized protein n=1 Tax=Tricholomella constricta TaxID=117010 RepID=A0A8H5M9V3_9AGAR|nr:hypothetical protein D9615_002254 [Tricholomella constricta]
MLWSKRRSSRQESYNSIPHNKLAQPEEQRTHPSRRQSIPTNSSPRFPFSPLDPLDPQGSQSSLVAAADDLSSSGILPASDPHPSVAKQSIGHQIINREVSGAKNTMSSEPRQTKSDNNRRSPKSTTQPFNVKPSDEMPGSLTTDLYTYNSLNSFSFGSVQPPAPSPSSRPVHPLSTGHGDADSIGEDTFLGPDVTPRPSVVAYNHLSQSRSHPAQPPSPLEGSSSTHAYPRVHDKVSTDRNPDHNGRESDTSSHIGISSASASVTSLSSTSADFSRTGSRMSHRTSSTNQTSADHSSIEDDEDDHHHPIPPHALSRSAESSGTNTGNNTAVEFSSDEEYGDSEYDYYDEESGMHIEISSARYEGSVVTYDWERNFYAGASGSNGSIRGQAGFGHSERRGSLPMVIPGTTPPLDVGETSMFSGGRNREDSLATLRRPSRSLDDDTKKMGLGRAMESSTSGEATLEDPLQSSPVSVPGSDGDWRLLQERSKSKGKAREMDKGLASTSDTGVTDQPSQVSPVPMDEFDRDWLQMRGGITAFDPSALGDIIGSSNSASSSNDRRPSATSTRWVMNFSRDARRPSTVSIYGGDSFGKAIRNWEGPRYKAQQRDWSFKREKADRQPDASIRRPSTTGFLTPRGSMMTERVGTPSGTVQEQEREVHKDSEKDTGPSSSSAWKGMRLNAQEFWRNDLVGRFRVDRRATRPTDESKGPQQRLVVQPIRDPYIEVPAYGPPVTIHKHSKAIAFSISRHYRLPRKRGDIPPTSSRTTDATLNAINSGSSVVPATKRSSSMILLAPRRVQEAYTSTNTTRKLESHGLLDDGAATSSLEVRDKERHRRNKERERQRQSQKEKPKEKERSKSNSVEVKGKGKGKQQAKDDRHVPSGSSPIAQPLPPPPASAPSLHTYPPGSTASSSSFVAREAHNADRAVSRNSSHQSRRRRRVRDPLEDDDDENENGPPTRTPHSEAFGTMDATLIEQLRQEKFHNSDSDRGGLWNRFLGRSAHSVTSSPAQLHAPFVPPWLGLQPRNKQESQQGVIDNLNDSFKDVGLLPSNYNTSRHAAPTSHRQRKIASGNDSNDPFREIPPDSLYMLLPLWPGDTDPRSEIAVASFERPFIRNDQRQYLLVYYKPDATDEEQRKTRGEKETRKRSRPSPTSSYDSITKRDDRASVLLSTFHITARLVQYKELQGTGVRVPDEGLTVTGPLGDAFNQMPPPVTETSPYEWVLGMCHSREGGIEFYPEGLIKMGLCLQTSAPREAPTSEEEEFPEPDVKLTPVGRAVLEMAWLGALALTSFGPGA